MSHRRTSDPTFRADQHTRLRDPHIEPISRLVDALSGSHRGFIPYVAPMYGGVMSEVLFLFQDPGPKTQGDAGSGMLCAENDDPTAELFANSLDAAGLDVSRTITWNAYPWYINKSPTIAQIDAGLEPLRQLLGLLPALRVVALMGRVAETSWARLGRRHPPVGRPLAVIPSLHPSGRGITRGGQTSRAEGIAQLIADMRKVLQIVD
jgi:hypothetical protein